MSFEPKALADGTVSSSLSSIFTATADATYVKNFTLFNSIATQQAILIYVNRTGVNRLWRRFELAEFESADVLDEGQTRILEKGDSILAISTTDAVVDFAIDGIEETF